MQSRRKAVAQLRPDLFPSLRWHESCSIVGAEGAAELPAAEGVVRGEQRYEKSVGNNDIGGACRLTPAARIPSPGNF